MLVSAHPRLVISWVWVCAWELETQRNSSVIQKTWAQSRGAKRRTGPPLVLSAVNQLSEEANRGLACPVYRGEMDEATKFWTRPVSQFCNFRVETDMICDKCVWIQTAHYFDRYQGRFE